MKTFITSAVFSASPRESHRVTTANYHVNQLAAYFSNKSLVSLEAVSDEQVYMTTFWS
jgi:hypothetical protein